LFAVSSMQTLLVQACANAPHSATSPDGHFLQVWFWIALLI